MASNFFCWFYSYNLSQNIARVLFLNWMWKFAFMCLTHHLLLTSGHNGALYRSVLPSFMSLIACKIPLCLSCMTHTFCTSWTTMFFNLSRNQYQLSPFSPSQQMQWPKEATDCYYQLPQLLGLFLCICLWEKCHLCKWPVNRIWKPECRHPMPRMTAEAQACLVSPHKLVLDIIVAARIHLNYCV
jgi:hypothetical protein